MTHCWRRQPQPGRLVAPRLAAVNKGGALKVLATAIFTELDLCKKLGIYKETMDAFLTSIEAGYRQVSLAA